MQPRIDAAVGHVAQLRAYVESNVALVGEHPAEVRALIDLVKNAGSQSAAVNGRLALFEEHFRTGQAAGVFGPLRRPDHGARLDRRPRRRRRHRGRGRAGTHRAHAHRP